LGVLAPVLPQNEVYGMPHKEVFRTPQNEVYQLPHNEVFRIAKPQNEVYRIVLPQNGALIIVNCQLSNQVKTIVDYLLKVAVKSSEILLSTLILAGEKLGWSIRIFLECLEHVLKMYTWSLSKNHPSIQFKCRLIGLLLKQSLFRKHDFAVCVYKVYHD
jgi:ATP sulfurylase